MRTVAIATGGKIMMRRFRVLAAVGAALLSVALCGKPAEAQYRVYSSYYGSPGFNFSVSRFGNPYGISFGYNFSPSFYTYGYRPGYYYSFPGGYTYTPPSYFVAPYYGPSLYGGYGYGYTGW